jgi:hypothetical protein
MFLNYGRFLLHLSAYRNAPLSDLTARKQESERPITLLFGAQFLAYRCEIRKLNN